MKLSPVFLSVRTREILHPKDGEPRQVVEVVNGAVVLGQLPVSKVVYEMLPQDLGKVTLTLVAQRAELDTHEVRS